MDCICYVYSNAVKYLMWSTVNILEDSPFTLQAVEISVQTEATLEAKAMEHLNRPKG